jgi:ribonuclease G
MASELIINVTSLETRVALLENGTLAELHIERELNKGVAGNIYKCNVQRILPGIQAAFVNVGLARSAFLYVDDVYNNTEKDFEQLMENFKSGNEATSIPPENEQNKQSPSPPIENILTENSEFLVQVIKEPIGSKGARISSHISLPGRYLVYLPTLDNTGISRRITCEDERKRLKEIIQEIKPEGSGFIIRTASEGASREDLLTDMEFLVKLWENIQKKTINASAPSLIHEDLSVSLRALRDLYSKNVMKVIVDDNKTYDEIISFIETFMPQLKYSVELYDREDQIFDRYGIEIEISRALGKRIWLKSGGYIIIEKTEALVAIDVNTGKFVGKGKQSDTILKTNLEAIKEIAYQTRLRNLGGIIIIDFIDMEKESDRQKVENTLEEALSRDRTKTNILPISELGLIQMTRKRVKENLSGQMCDSCPYCEGKGLIKSVASIAYDVVRAIKREPSSGAEEKVFVLAHPDVVAFLYDEESSSIELAEKEINKKIIIKSDTDFHHEEFEIFTR